MQSLLHTGLQPTCTAWMPDSLYVATASGQLCSIATDKLLNARGQRAQQAGPTATAEGLFQQGPAPDTGGQAQLSVVAHLEWNGQLVHIEAVAVNKDCVAVAGHSPIIRFVAAFIYQICVLCMLQYGLKGEDTQHMFLARRVKHGVQFLQSPRLHAVHRSMSVSDCLFDPCSSTCLYSHSNYLQIVQSLTSKLA